MSKQVEGIGKTYEEAVRDGLDKIQLSKNEVTIEEIKEHKKTFFSILEPRIVKVKITEIEANNKEKVVEIHNKTTPNMNEEISTEDIEKTKRIIDEFITEFIEKLGISLQKNIEYKEGILEVNLSGEKAGLIIGYRGETLDALQTIVNNVVSKQNKDAYVRVIIDAENYRKKRIKTLEALALKEADRVINKRKSITLEPMVAYERKAIHTALQNHPKVKSLSVGEEPYRKVVISLK